MNYKDLIKSRRLRIKIMQFLSFVPDELMIKFQYKIKTGRKLSLKKPMRFTEKLQWYKLNYRDPLMAQCVDKWDVREYIKTCRMDDILIESYGVFDNPDEIDFDKLPNSFVIKDTLGAGGNSVIVVSDKNQMDVNNIRGQMIEWMESPIHKKHPGREWVYDNKKHRIIIEKYIEADAGRGGLIDYKFFCFNGKVEYMYVIADREMGKKAGLGIFDANYENTNVCRVDEALLAREITKPDNFEEMKRIAEKLSAPFPEARIDLYNVNGKILFGEITFFDGSGYMTFHPDAFDFTLGSKFILPEKRI